MGNNFLFLSHFLLFLLELKPSPKLMYDALMTTIKEKYPEVHPDNLQFTFPPWLTFVEQQ
jgi:hypothetical protein